MALLGERKKPKLWRRQFDEGTWVGGSYTKGDERVTKIRGTFRPMPGKEVQQLDLGHRHRDGRVLYTRTRLLITDQHDNQPSDHISPDAGATYYEVVREYDGDEAGFDGVRHWRYGLVRLQEEDDGSDPAD